MRPGNNATRGWAPKQTAQILPRLSAQQLGSIQKTKSPHPAEPLAASVTFGPDADDLPELPQKHGIASLTANTGRAGKTSSRGNMLAAEHSSALPPLLRPQHGADPGIPALHTFLVAQADNPPSQETTIPVGSQGSLTADSGISSLPSYARPQNRTPVWSERERRGRNAMPANPYKQRLDLADTIKPVTNTTTTRTSTNVKVEVSPGRYRVAPLEGSAMSSGRRSDPIHLTPLMPTGRLSKASFLRLPCLLAPTSFPLMTSTSEQCQKLACAQMCCSNETHNLGKPNVVAYAVCCASDDAMQHHPQPSYALLLNLH